MCVCLCVCVCVCVCTCVYIYIYIYVRTYLYARTRFIFNIVPLVVNILLVVVMFDRISSTTDMTLSSERFCPLSYIYIYIYIYILGNLRNKKFHYCGNTKKTITLFNLFLSLSLANSPFSFFFFLSQCNFLHFIPFSF